MIQEKLTRRSSSKLLFTFSPSPIILEPLFPIPFPICNTQVRLGILQVVQKQNDGLYDQVERPNIREFPFSEDIQQRRQLVFAKVPTVKIDPLAINSKYFATQNYGASAQHRPDKLKYALCPTRNDFSRRDVQLAPTLARNARTPVGAVEGQNSEISAATYERCTTKDIEWTTQLIGL